MYLREDTVSDSAGAATFATAPGPPPAGHTLSIIELNPYAHSAAQCGRRARSYQE